MKNITTGLFIFVFVLYGVFTHPDVYGQGFHHPPPPPPQHHQQTPQRPPSPPPTRVVPPPRPETMRPPSTPSLSDISDNIETLATNTQETVGEWKDEVVDRITDVGNWIFGFEEDDDLANIDVIETDASDDVFAEKATDENAYWAEVKATWDDVDPESAFYDSINEFLSTLNDDGSPKISPLELAGSAKEPIPPALAKQGQQVEIASETFVTPELKPTESPNEPLPTAFIEQGQQPEGTLKFGEQPQEITSADPVRDEFLPDVAPERIVVKEPAGPTLTEMIKITENVNLQKMEKILTQSDQKPPTEFLSVNGYQPTESTRTRVETATEFRERTKKPPTDTQLIDSNSDINPEKNKEADSFPDRIDVQPNRINLNNEEFTGTIIVDQVDPETQKQLVDIAEQATALTYDATLLYVGVQFPLAGTVISGFQGAATGLDNAIENGKSPYEAVWNMTVGAVTNAGTGIVGGKIGNLGKFKNADSGLKKLVNTVVDYGGAVVTNDVGGRATEGMTNYGDSFGTNDGGIHVMAGHNNVY